jgi:hypothetical protein
VLLHCGAGLLGTTQPGQKQFSFRGPNVFLNRTFVLVKYDDTDIFGN